MPRILIAAITFVIATVMTGCASANTGPVSAEVKEFSITLGRTSATAGTVVFNVKNTGTIVHEFVVIDTDNSAGSFTVGADGTVPEEGMTVVDEIEDIAVGATPSLSVNLPAGHYAIICNVAGHYAGGMHVDFQVQ